MTQADPRGAMPMVDAHHHLWDPASRAYPWMTGEAERLKRSFTVADLDSAIAPTPISCTIVVQASAEMAETRELLAIAAASRGRVVGVVGWVDLRAPNVADSLGALRAGEGGSRLVGIRHQVHDEVDPAWLLGDDVLRGLRAVDEAGLVFDLLVRAREMPAAVELARTLPSLRLVLDHAGKPPIASGNCERWADLLAALGKHQNVSCKLSGLLTEAGKDWNTDLLRPYADRILGAFGAGRVMYGSDWPVSTLRAPYESVYNTSVALIEHLTPAEMTAIFGVNAAATYGLPLDLAA